MAQESVADVEEATLQWRVKLTRGWCRDMDRRIKVYAKLCQSIMKRAPCLTLASQHMARVGMAGGTCTGTTRKEGFSTSAMSRISSHLSQTVNQNQK